jgi:hypothetical protein
MGIELLRVLRLKLFQKKKDPMSRADEKIESQGVIQRPCGLNTRDPQGYEWETQGNDFFL